MAESIEQQLKTIFLRVFQGLKPENFTFEMPRSDFENWDSLTHMQLVSEIESNIGVNFSMDEIAEISKPADFLDLIVKKTRNGNE